MPKPQKKWPKDLQPFLPRDFPRQFFHLASFYGGCLWPLSAWPGDPEQFPTVHWITAGTLGKLAKSLAATTGSRLFFPSWPRLHWTGREGGWPGGRPWRLPGLAPILQFFLFFQIRSLFLSLGSSTYLDEKATRRQTISKGSCFENSEPSARLFMIWGQTILCTT